MASAKPPKANGRDLLARRMLQLERHQAATNARLDITNMRLEKLESTVETGFRLLLEELRGLRTDLHGITDRVTALEGRAS